MLPLKYDLIEMQLNILNPCVREDTSDAPLAPQLANASDARVAFVDNSKVNADLFLSRLKPLLQEKYGVHTGVTVRKLAPKDELSADDLERLADYDAVIQCFGDCGTSTSMTVADGVKLERLGVPTATVISTAFARAARSQAAGRGMEDLPIVEIPHPMHTAPKDDVYARAEAVLPSVISALTQRTEARRTSSVEPAPSELEVDSEAVQELFFERGWTDGLPVVPPTAARV